MSQVVDAADWRNSNASKCIYLWKKLTRLSPSVDLCKEEKLPPSFDGRAVVVVVGVDRASPAKETP